MIIVYVSCMFIKSRDVEIFLVRKLYFLLKKNSVHLKDTGVLPVFESSLTNFRIRIDAYVRFAIQGVFSTHHQHFNISNVYVYMCNDTVKISPRYVVQKQTSSGVKQTGFFIHIICITPIR